jgi:hypothetical protein
MHRNSYSQSSLVLLDIAKFFWLGLFTTCPTWEVGFGNKSGGTDSKPTLTTTSWREPRHSTILEARKRE